MQFDFLNPQETHTILTDLIHNDVLTEEFRKSFMFIMGLNVIDAEKQGLDIVKVRALLSDVELFDIECIFNGRNS